jgi:thiol-disulfide isomerase/thioredoxin
VSVDRLVWRAAVGVLAFAVAGCGERASSTTGDVTPAAKSEAAVAASNAVQFATLRLPLIDGGEFDSAAQRGNWVVVNYWATWCPPCVKEMPELSELHDAHENVSVVGLTYEQIEADVLRAALAKRPVSYPIAIVDPFEMPAGVAAPRGLPTTYLVDPQGNVAREFLGPVTRADIERAIAAF